jgi:transposase
MADLFGVSLVTATIARISRDCAQRFQSFAAGVRDHVAAAPVKHMDETGFRIGGKTQWLHIASTILLTFYRISPKRGSLLANVDGIVVHDHWKPYYTLEGVLHALCNAHHLRELKALVEIEKEHWARKMQCLLRRACHATNLARDRGVPLTPALIVLIGQRYDAILAEGLSFHEAQPALISATAKLGRRGRPPRRVGHNLLLRLSSRKEDVLRFLTDPRVPFTNNLGERDGRMMKLRQKISGGFRSEDGARDFAVIRSLLSTAKKPRLESPPNAHRRPKPPDRRPPPRLTVPAIPGQLPAALYLGSPAVPVGRGDWYRGLAAAQGWTRCACRVDRASLVSRVAGLARVSGRAPRVRG